MDLPVSSLERHWLDALPLPAVIIRQQRFVYANRAFLELLQLTESQALGMRFDERVAPEDLQRVRARHALRTRGERVPDAYEFNVLRTDGVRLRVEIFVTQLDDATVFQLHDVTDRVRRHEHLGALARLGASVQGQLDEHEIFRALDAGLSALGAGLVRMRPEGDHIRVVSAVGEVGVMQPLGAGGWTPNLQRAWESGYAFIDDLRGAAVQYATQEMADQAARFLSEHPWVGGAVLRLETPGRPRELLMLMASWIRPEDEATLRLFGAQVSAALNASRVVADLGRRNAELAALDRVATAAGSAAPLGELFRRACAEATQVLGCGHLAIYLLDREKPEATLAYTQGASEEAERGYAKVSLAGTRLNDVVMARAPRVWKPSDYDPKTQAVLERMGERSIASVPMMARSRVIGVINVAWLEERSIGETEIAVISGLGVHLASAVETTRLVDDLRRSYEDLSRTQDQLVQRERLAALGEMAAAVAHEVRNPLAVIFNSVGSLRRHPSDLDLLAIVQEEAERIDHLVGDLLEFARPLTPMLSAEVPLEALLKEALAAVLPTAAPQVRLQLEVPAVGPVPLDPRLMRQVFVNLATNAVQAMPSGGTLKVSLARLEGERPSVRVAFEDTGHGIPADVLPRIFEPFFTTRARGTGLGLALVKRIVEGHRGTVSAESRPGSTVLEVEWPAA